MTALEDPVTADYHARAGEIVVVILIGQFALEPITTGGEMCDGSCRSDSLRSRLSQIQAPLDLLPDAPDTPIGDVARMAAGPKGVKPRRQVIVSGLEGATLFARARYDEFIPSQCPHMSPVPTR
jgi:hypothetical protein